MTREIQAYSGVVTLKVTQHTPQRILVSLEFLCGNNAAPLPIGVTEKQSDSYKNGSCSRDTKLQLAA